MQFFKQSIPGSCNIVAIRQCLAFYQQFPSYYQVKRQLPRHSFGSLISEIAIFFHQLGFSTQLINNHDSNQKSVENKTEVVLDNLSKQERTLLKKYQMEGDFIQAVPQVQDFDNYPVIINVDSLKIAKKQGKPSSHYVVVIKKKATFQLYDGYNFDVPQSIYFEDLLNASIDINARHQRGMWLKVLNR